MQRVTDGHLDHRIVTDYSWRRAGPPRPPLQPHGSAPAGEARQKIQRHSRLLEKRVDERTKQLQEAYHDLQALERAKDGFLSSLSHEMRTPLTSIMAACEILSQYADDDPQTRKEFLYIIQHESQTLLTLIGQLLDLAKLEARALQLQVTSSPMDRLITDVLDRVQARANEKNVMVRST